MPGGRNANRPYFQFEGSYTTAWSWKGDDYLVWMEDTITNRGEESIAKNWELCLVDDGTPVRLKPGQMIDSEIDLPDGDKILQGDLLIEKTIRNPLPHGRAVTGWIAFSISKELATKIIARKKFPDGSIQFEDYLAHTFSFDFVGNDETTKKKPYIPGHN